MRVRFDPFPIPKTMARFGGGASKRQHKHKVTADHPAAASPPTTHQDVVGDDQDDIEQPKRRLDAPYGQPYKVVSRTASTVKLLPHDKEVDGGTTTQSCRNLRRTTTTTISPFIIVACTLGALLVVELMVILAFATPHAIALMSALTQATHEVVLSPNSSNDEGSGGIGFKLDVDAGPRIEALLGGDGGTLGMGAQFLTSQLKVHRVGGDDGNGSSEEGGGDAKNATGLATADAAPSSLDAEESSMLFVNWCKAAECMAKDAALCDGLEADLASARSPGGAPIIPLPPSFCSAIEILNLNRCLCDIDLGDAAVVGETSQIVETAPLLGTLCGLTITSHAQGTC